MIRAAAAPAVIGEYIYIYTYIIMERERERERERDNHRYIYMYIYMNNISVRAHDNDVDIRAYIGLLVGIIKARGLTTSRGTRRGAVIICSTLCRQVETATRRQ